MKKRLLTALVAGVVLVSLTFPGTVVKADPTNVDEARSEYETLNNKIEELNTKIEQLDNEISPIVSKMNENEDKINTLNEEIDETNVQVDKAKEDISEQEEVLGNRLREVYKSGGEVNYLSIIFSSSSLSDLISKVSSAKKVIELDNEMVDELNDKKAELDSKVESLQTKADEIKDINKELKKQQDEIQGKIDEQQTIKDQAEADQKELQEKYLDKFERELVNDAVNTAKNSSNSSDTINSAVQLLKTYLAQLKSPTVIDEVNSAISAGKTNYNTAKNREQSAAAATAAASSNNTDRGSSVTGITATGTASAVLQVAYSLAGLPYQWGATGPSSYDCSGFTQYVYKKATGIDIGRTTYVQINAGKAVSYDELQPGDLVFPHEGHVGIYIGNGQMIHAPRTGDVIKVSSVYKFMTGRRILN
ncbi:C40 family peptidase [Clostridium sp. MSJ-8]|uniref:C40 family peptidase n=1 Tax=Clostridium sp. MSJ-8 TaxID=2841510 RepID=UPI001C0F1C5F|nr:C40 family peptidase [Clostridium sp. MSJ-8]MBU5488342.1 C40 family peptidase [Clostridium sp. MSJ-8]